ncbi:MAG: hypothetical protein IPJ77_17805 [Planctomycetes bacterium]|nr:hypothetical protein [Planctomycetota bacterium]
MTCRSAVHAFRYAGSGGGAIDVSAITQRQKKLDVSLPPLVTKPFGAYRSGSPSFCRSKKRAPQPHPAGPTPARSVTSSKRPPSTAWSSVLPRACRT